MFTASKALLRYFTLEQVGRRQVVTAVPWKISRYDASDLMCTR